jgi:hypothetical protein
LIYAGRRCGGWTLLALAGLVPISAVSGVMRGPDCPRDLRNDTAPGMSPCLMVGAFLLLRKRASLGARRVAIPAWG